MSYRLSSKGPREEVGRRLAARAQGWPRHIISMIVNITASSSSNNNNNDNTCKLDYGVFIMCFNVIRFTIMIIVIIITVIMSPRWASTCSSSCAWGRSPRRRGATTTRQQQNRSVLYYILYAVTCYIVQ